MRFTLLLLCATPFCWGVERILFSRLAPAQESLYISNADGSGERVLSQGSLTSAPQPYGEVFVVRYDGTGLEQLTDNQWEEAGPAWQPHKK